MPLEVTEWKTVTDYIDSAVGVKVYFRIKGRRLTVVAGMLSWTGDTKDADEFQERKDFLEGHEAIEVEGYREVRELFS